MPALPSAINRLLSKIHTTRPEATLPSYQVDPSDITLFDDLPAGEKELAVAKLQALASEQPGSATFLPKRRRSFWRTFIMVFLSIGFIVATILAGVAFGVDQAVNPDLVARLRMATTNLDRMALLPSDSDWLFDFTQSDKYTFAPGGVINANAATFPATVGQGMTMAMLNLGPCSMLPPHIHPRATNFVVAISGTTRTWMIAENGARTVTEVLEAGQMTIFPSASVHSMMNIGCENAQLVSALNSDDTGTTNLANTFFSLPQNISGTIVGGDISVQSVLDRVPAVGTGAAWGPDECRAACARQGKKVRRDF